MTPLILTYHYCRSLDDKEFPGLKGVSPVTFERQIVAIAPCFKSELPRKLDPSNSEYSNAEIWITFDDGFKDTYDKAYPVLKRHGLNAVVFVCSAPLMEGVVLDVHKVHLLHARLGFDRFRRAILETIDNMGITSLSSLEGSTGHDGHYRYDRAPVKALKNFLNYEITLADREACLRILFKSVFGCERDIAQRFYMSVDDIKRWQDSGFGIGAHTHRHPPLSRLSKIEQEIEIKTNIEFLKAEFGVTDPPFAYPHGVTGTWNQDTLDVLRESKITLAMTCVRSKYTPGNTRELEIPRHDVNDVFDGEGGVKMDGHPFVGHFDLNH